MKLISTFKYYSLINVDLDREAKWNLALVDHSIKLAIHLYCSDFFKSKLIIFHAVNE